MRYKPYAPIPMVPGPTTLLPQVLEAMTHDYGSGDLEPDFLALYAKTTALFQPILGTQNDIVFMTGEGMLALWAGLKSCLRPKDTVLCLGNGVFGDGIAPMAASIGCRVETLSFPYDSTFNQGDHLSRIEEAIRRVRPQMITAIHCETPSGTLNPLEGIGALKKQYGVPLLYVDAVASAGGAPVLSDQWHIDLTLVGSQKCLSAPPSMSIMAVSSTAWQVAKEVNYQGYDALLPFATVMQTGSPYTPYWHGLAGLHAAAAALHQEGLENVYLRHASVAASCRHGLTSLGISLFPQKDAVASPTVTAAFIPNKHTFASWQQKLRTGGLAIGGSYGPMEGRVFRLGHMGAQACSEYMQQALKVIRNHL